jgi:DNA-binding response OmpR family regulator
MQHSADQVRDPVLFEGGPRRSLSTILCIDDDPEITRIWQIRLSRYGITVVCAANGADGFAMAREKSPDVILLDLCLPYEDGHQVLIRLRSDPQTRDIPVLMLTGGDARAVERQASLHRADDYLSKPINFAELLERLATHIPISRLSSPNDLGPCDR